MSKLNFPQLLSARWRRGKVRAELVGQDMTAASSAERSSLHKYAMVFMAIHAGPNDGF